MNRKSRQFKELQQYWYTELEKSGFKDIEKNEDRLHQYCSLRSPRWGLSELSADSRLNYYLGLSQKFWEYAASFPDDKIDYYVMFLFSKGHTNPEIRRKLAGCGKKVGKDVLRIMRRRYEHKWGIIEWKEEQMTLTRKKKT